MYSRRSRYKECKYCTNNSRYTIPLGRKTSSHTSGSEFLHWRTQLKMRFEFNSHFNGMHTSHLIFLVLHRPHMGEKAFADFTINGMKSVYRFFLCHFYAHANNHTTMRSHANRNLKCVQNIGAQRRSILCEGFTHKSSIGHCEYRFGKVCRHKVPSKPIGGGGVDTAKHR